MKRFLVLAFALLFLAAIQVVPQTDLMDADGGFSYAILSKNYSHPPSSTSPANLPVQRPISAEQQPRDGARFPEIGASAMRTSLRTTVLRC